MKISLTEPYFGSVFFVFLFYVGLPISLLLAGRVGGLLNSKLRWLSFCRRITSSTVVKNFFEEPGAAEKMIDSEWLSTR